MEAAADDLLMFWSDFGLIRCALKPPTSRYLSLNQIMAIRSQRNVQFQVREYFIGLEEMALKSLKFSDFNKTKFEELK